MGDEGIEPLASKELIYSQPLAQPTLFAPPMKLVGNRRIELPDNHRTYIKSRVLQTPVRKIPHKTATRNGYVVFSRATVTLSLYVVEGAGFEPTLRRYDRCKHRPAFAVNLVRVLRIELRNSAWQADSLPLAYTRMVEYLFIDKESQNRLLVGVVGFEPTNL